MSVIVVTGATGNVGRQVVKVLVRRGVTVRAAVRSSQRTAGSFDESVARVHLDFERPETFAAAVAGARGLFLLRPPAIARVRHTLIPLVDIAMHAGVETIVFLSVLGAERARFIPHRTVERHLERRCPSWTFLRAGFFAQNLGDAYRADIREDDRLYLPAGDGKVAFIDVRDVAEVAALALLESPPKRQAWSLTGPQALGFNEVAALLSRELGRSIRYEPATLGGYARHLRRRGLRRTQVAVQTALHAAVRWGHAAQVDPTLQEIMRRPPLTLRDYLRDHHELWRRS